MPVKNGPHRQVKLLADVRHVALFRQGWDRQLFIWTSQVGPVKPGRQLQVAPKGVSLQRALFWQGVEAQ